MKSVSFVRVACIVSVFGSVAIGCGNSPPPVPTPTPTATTTTTTPPPGPDDDAGVGDAAAVAQVDAAPPEVDVAVIVLAKNQHASSALTADGQHVYWVEDVEGTVTRITKRGGAMMMFYSSSTGGFASPSTIAIDDKDVYWTEHTRQESPGAAGPVLGSIQKLEKMGGKPTLIASGIRDELRSLAVDDKSVYWIAGGAIMRASKSGGGVAPLTFKLNDPTSVAGDGKYVYWTQTGPLDKKIEGGAVVRQLTTPGSKQEAIATAQDKPSNVLVDEAGIYWVASGTKIFGTAMKPLTPKMIAESAGGVIDTALDEKFVYWLGGDGTVMRVARDGSSPAEKLASGQTNPIGIAVDKTNVYWSTKGTDANKFRDGTVAMRAKP